MARIRGTSGDDNLRGTSRRDRIFGLGGGDRLLGRGGSDRLEGGSGQDLLIGGNGQDTLFGGRGNDIYAVDDGGDRPIERADEGTDTVRSTVSFRLGSHIENLNLLGGQALNGIGNTIANVISGNRNNNVLRGLGGGDRLLGRAGNDRLEGGAGNDILIGGAGNDLYQVEQTGDRLIERANQGTDAVQSQISFRLGDHLENLNLIGNGFLNGTGNRLNNILVGNSSNNRLSGRSGNDILRGQSGDDILQGSSRSAAREIDVLAGGAGADQFVLGTLSAFLYNDGNAANPGTADYALIIDFEPLTGDWVQLRGTPANYLLRDAPAGLPAGRALYLDRPGEEPDELVAIFRGVFGLDLDADYFRYVQPDRTASAPNLTTQDVSGSEDSLIPLNIAAALTDTDGSERLSIEIRNVPDGATLSAGQNQGNGVWTLTPAQLNGLGLNPTANFSGMISLSVVATAIERSNGDRISVIDNLEVTVNAVADTPAVIVQPAAGLEDTAIPLNIIAALTDTDGSESLLIRIAGVPEGATLSAGTMNQAGIWILTPAQLSNLTLTPPANRDQDFNLTVTAIATETANGSTAGAFVPLPVTVIAVADAPALAVQPAIGLEDTAIPLSISANLVDTDGSESLSNITISGVPIGAALSAGINNGSGIWTLTPAQLTNLSITPVANSDADFILTVAATSTEAATGNTATTTAPLAVTVNADADPPILTVQNVAGSEDAAIPLNITAALTDTDGSESFTSAFIAGVPLGATLSAGSNQGGGIWAVNPAQLAGLAIAPPANSDTDFALSISLTTTEAMGNDAVTLVNTFNVTVNAEADVPTLQVQDAVGLENEAIALNISTALTDLDGSETLSLRIADVPTGAALSAGTNLGNGVWTLSPAQLNNLSITANSPASFDLIVTATATENANGTTAIANNILQVTVNPIINAAGGSLGTSSFMEPLQEPRGDENGITPTSGIGALLIAPATDF